MRLRIVTPIAMVVDQDNVVSITAEDESGSFGIFPGHVDFVTALSISVVSWKQAGGSWRHCAVSGGSLTVDSGRTVTITSRTAVPGDDLETLHGVVISRFLSDADAEKKEHTESTGIQLAAIRQIMRQLHPADKGGAWS